MIRYIVIAALALMIIGAVAHADPIRWRLLSDNAGYTGPALHTGVTYTWQSAPDNPADSTGRRLLDGDRPGDWTNATGWNGKDNAVTFDFGRPYTFEKLRFYFFEALPQSVELFSADKLADKPEDTKWASIGKLEPIREGWNELDLTSEPEARYVKVFVKMAAWGVYFREAQFIGTAVGEAKPPFPPVRHSGNALVLADGGKPYCSVVVDEAGSAQAISAAWQLRDAISQMSGANIPIFDVREKPTGARLVVGSGELSRALKVSVLQEYPGAETSVIKSVGDDVILLGNEAGLYAGTQYAVVEFLRRLGCGWFGEERLWHSIPHRTTVTAPALNISSTPAIAMRNIWYVPASVGVNWGLGGDRIECGHALSYMFPPEQYFKEHPEYYPLIAGKRVAEGEFQLCTTNPDVIRLSAQKAAEAFDKSPSLVAFSLSNNDCGGFCECPECGQARAGAGNPNANAMLRYANAVARELRKTHPTARVCFLAYWYTLGAPDPALKAEPGVVVMQVDEGCKAHALDDPACERNAGWCKNFAAWAATGAEMAIYEWYIPGCADKRWLKLPWVSGDVAVRNIRWWLDHNVKWITYESQAAYSEPLPQAWPLYYVAARAMQNPKLAAHDILAEACASLYGPAAGEMLAYYETLEKAVTATKLHTGNWALPDPAQLYNARVRAACREHLSRALELARPVDDPAVWQRVSVEVENWRIAELTLEG